MIETVFSYDMGYFDVLFHADIFGKIRYKIAHGWRPYKTLAVMTKRPAGNCILCFGLLDKRLKAMIFGCEKLGAMIERHPVFSFGTATPANTTPLIKHKALSALLVQYTRRCDA